MTFRGYFLAMGGATAFAWLAWVLVVWRMNPDEAGLAGLVAFFLTFGLGLVGVFATGSMAYRVLVLRRSVILREARIAFRQALLLALAACAFLILASQDVFFWWTALLIFLVFGGIEYLASSLDRHSRT